MRIRSAAVLGAGTMGAQIAAHLANAGVPSLLLDVSLDAARQGLKRAQALKPDPFFTRSTPALIQTGSLDDLSVLRSCDWIIEAVVERLDVKQALIERVEREAPATAIVSSNTSGIPISRIAEGRGDRLQKTLAGDAFLQSAAIPAAARGHSDHRHRRRRSPDRDRVRRPAPRERCGDREGHPGVHRQPARHLRTDAGLQGDGGCED